MKSAVLLIVAMTCRDPGTPLSQMEAAYNQLWATWSGQSMGAVMDKFAMASLAIEVQQSKLTEQQKQVFAEDFLLPFGDSAAARDKAIQDALLPCSEAEKQLIVARFKSAFNEDYSNEEELFWLWAAVADIPLDVAVDEGIKCAKLLNDGRLYLKSFQ